MSENFKQCIDLVDKWMETHDTPPDIQTCITRSLQARRLNTLFTAFSSPFCHQAVAEQDIIGWQNFVEGKISRRWRLLQEEYLHDSDSTQLVTKWASGLVLHLLELTHSQWKVRSTYLHERNHQGLCHKQAVKLEMDITMEFAKGYVNLAQ
jgi:hypothetical protein